MAYSLRYLTSWFFLNGAALFICASAHAQDRAKEVSIEFTVFSPARLRNVAFCPSKEKPLVALETYSSSRSQVYRYRGPELLRFYDSREGTAHPRVVAQIKVPANVSKLFLVFTPAPTADRTASGHYEVRVVDDTISSFPAGHFVVLNLTDQTYSGKIGGVSIPVGPGKSRPFKATKTTGVELTRADIELEFNLVQERVLLREDQRAILLLLPPAEQGSYMPVVRRILDEVTTPKKKA